MAELMLAGNTHTSVVLRAIGVQDGRPYDKNYAFPNRFTLVRSLNSTATHVYHDTALRPSLHGICCWLHPMRYSDCDSVCTRSPIRG